MSTIHTRHGRATRAATAVLAALLVATLFAAAQAAPAGAAVPGAFTKTKSMATARYRHTATRLNDGRILVTGGYSATRSAELYTPSTKSWSAAASMKDVRSEHTATVLSDGRVLVVGGYSSGALNTAEIYNPANNTWSRTGSLSFARADHTATLLADGKVLVAGGWGDGASPYTSELYDPGTGTFVSVGYMNYYRTDHVAARVSSKKVLVAGTSYYCSCDTTTPRSAEVYNETSNTWSVVGEMGVGRRDGATATVLSDGRILISGGETSSYDATSAAELFNPTTNTFSFTGDLNDAVYYDHDATRLNDGRVLVTGGYGSDGSAEIFDPSSGQWQLTGSLLEDRSDHTATALSSGKVLIAGGYGDSGTLDSAEIFDPSASSIQDDKVTPKVAWSGSVALVVWQDGRNGNPDIYGARLDANGNPLGSSFAISTAAGEQTQPTVAWNGTDFLVAWADRRSGTDTNIYSTRVSTTGVVSNPSGKLVSGAANDQSFPIARANSARQWLIVWQDGRGGSSTDVYGSRIATNGTVSDPSGIAISTAVRDQRRPTVAANGSTWFVVWGDRRPANGNSDIYGTRVTSTGSVSSPNGVAVSTAAADQSNPQVAWNGTTFLVVWSDYRSGSSLDVYGSRVNAGGATLNAGGIAISKLTGVTEAPSSVSAIGSTFLVAWQDDRNGTYDIYGSRVSDSGTVANPNGAKINSSAQDQSSPAVGVDGSQFLVVWGDTRSGANSDIYATRVSTSGVVQSSNGFVVAS